MAEQSPKIRLRIRFTTRVKFITIVRADSTVATLKRNVLGILSSNYGIVLSNIQLLVMDGYEVLDKNRVGDVMEMGEDVVVESLGNINRVNEEDASNLKPEPPKKVTEQSKKQSPVKKEEAPVEVKTEQKKVVEPVRPKTTPREERETDKVPVFKPGFKGFAVRSMDLPVKKQQKKTEEFVPLKKAQKEDSFELI